jgi:hypothetical protein
LGAARAKSITFVSDRACWIWNRLDWVIARAGLDPKRIERVLDFYHAVHHVSLALQSLGLSEAERTRRYHALLEYLRCCMARAARSPCHLPHEDITVPPIVTVHITHSPSRGGSRSPVL